MRKTCQVMLPGGICGKPAVEFLQGVRDKEGEVIEERFYFCAEHWNDFDQLRRECRALERL